MPAMMEARIMDVPSGTLISLSSMVKVTCLFDKLAGVP
jgi:hypothetical protein